LPLPLHPSPSLNLQVMARVLLSELHKRFNATLAVDNFSLDVAEGEFVALLGPSGCGKTTVMRMIAGISEPDSGTIAIGERRVDGLSPERRNIGLVFQSYALFPHMTVEANIAFGLQMRHVPRDEMRRRIAAVLEMVDLTALAKRHPRQLSGGQQQRVALSRALVTEPDVLLLDEPLSNLDAKLREHLREDIKTLQRRLGITTIYVTHDQSEALALADRVVVMNGGRIVEQGTPRDLYQTPAHRFTAEFLGQTNILTAVAADRAICFPWGGKQGGWDGRSGPVDLSIRPEDISIEATAEGPAVVTDVTFLGADIEHKLDVGGLMIRARSSGRGAKVLPVGTRVSIGLPGDLHVLS
jgi:putative spermidine/putrescine transport system ATP-binding protein